MFGGTVTKLGVLAAVVLAVLLSGCAPPCDTKEFVEKTATLSPGDQFLLTTPAADKGCVGFDLSYYEAVGPSQLFIAGNENQLGDLSGAFHVDSDGVVFPLHPAKLFSGKSGEYWEIEFEDHGDYNGNSTAKSATYYIKLAAPRTLKHKVTVSGKIYYRTP